MTGQLLQDTVSDMREQTERLQTLRVHDKRFLSALEGDHVMGPFEEMLGRHLVAMKSGDVDVFAASCAELANAFYAAPKNALISAIEQSHASAVNRMTEDGVPIGIDAVRCDVSYHTAHGWREAITGDVVMLQNDDDSTGAPEVSRASHQSG